MALAVSFEPAPATTGTRPFAVLTVISTTRLKNVLHREQAALSDDPLCRDDRAFGEYPSIARNVRQPNRLEGSVEDGFVSPRDRAGPNAGDRYVLAPGLGCRSLARFRGAGWGIFLRRVMRFDQMRIEAAAASDDSRRGRE